jgi:hypothetical protein
VRLCGPCTSPSLAARLLPASLEAGSDGARRSRRRHDCQYQSDCKFINPAPSFFARSFEAHARHSECPISFGLRRVLQCGQTVVAISASQWRARTNPSVPDSIFARLDRLGSRAPVSQLPTVPFETPICHARLATDIWLHRANSRNLRDPFDCAMIVIRNAHICRCQSANVFILTTLLRLPRISACEPTE